jgi:hypothetical protein
VVLRAPSLAPVLALATDGAERDRLAGTPWASTLAKGLALLEHS